MARRKKNQNKYVEKMGLTETILPDGSYHKLENPERISIFSQTSVSGDFKSPTPYTYSAAEYRMCKGRVKNPYALQYGIIPGTLHYSQGVPPFEVSQADQIEQARDKAIHKLYSKLRGHGIEAGHESLVDIFESPELKRLYKQLGELISSFRNNKSFFRMALRAHPAVLASELYLMWTFGIQPIISSIKDILQTLKNGGEFSTSIEAGALIQQAVDMPDWYLYGPDGPPVEVLAVRNIGVKYKYYLHMQDPVELIKSQFGLDTPAASYYASMRLTFVLDWFINVGKFLSEVEYRNTQRGWKIINGTKTTRISYVRQLQIVGNHEWFGIDTEYNVSALHKDKYLKRELISYFPRPPLPKFKVDLTPGKLVSLAALLITNVKIQHVPTIQRRDKYKASMRSIRLAEAAERKRLRQLARQNERRRSRVKSRGQLNHNMTSQ